MQGLLPRYGHGGGPYVSGVCDSSRGPGLTRWSRLGREGSERRLSNLLKVPKTILKNPQLYLIQLSTRGVTIFPSFPKEIHLFWNQTHGLQPRPFSPQLMRQLPNTTPLYTLQRENLWRQKNRHPYLLRYPCNPCHSYYLSYTCFPPRADLRLQCATTLALARLKALCNYHERL